MRLIDTNRFYLPNTNSKWLHLASIQDGVHEYMCFMEVSSQRVYIEEITGGHIERIESDKLAWELSQFLTFHGVINITRPPLSDDEWLRGKKV